MTEINDALYVLINRQETLNGKLDLLTSIAITTDSDHITSATEEIRAQLVAQEGAEVALDIAPVEQWRNLSITDGDEEGSNADDEGHNDNAST